MKVILRKKAQNSINAIAEYIENKGYPDTAYKFALRMEKFTKTLTGFTNKYPICRHPKFAKKNLHCAVFEKNYIFIYKVVRSNLVIYNIIHVRTSPAFYKA